MNKSDKILKQFYIDFLVGKYPKYLQNQILYQLYKRPKKDKESPKIQNLPAHLVVQVDILYLPDDDGYKYALVAVDVGNRLTDAEPMKKIDKLPLMQF